MHNKGQDLGDLMDKKPSSVLCLDIEGGHGGSSRSLFFLIQKIDRSLIEPIVWCRHSGIASAYRELGIEVSVEPDMPKVTSVRKFSRNLVLQTGFYAEWVRARSFRRRLLTRISAGIDVVHANHESLSGLIGWLSRHSKCHITCHIRTILPHNLMARRQIRIISNAVSGLVFITENEKDSFMRLGGALPTSAKIIYNVVPSNQHVQTIAPSIMANDRFKIASISNFAYVRGTDRLVEIAECLKKLGHSDILFIVAGDMNLPKSILTKLNHSVGDGRTLQDVAKEHHVDDMFCFTGHVSNPESLLAGCDLAIKPTRENNPWGRDIIEALGAGIPVASVGTYDRFVQTGETGLLQSEFDPWKMAYWILHLKNDPGLRARLGRKAQERIRKLCDPNSGAASLSKIWRETAQSNEP
jgi:glycosyltransferase involved in cell wall biosynthesis